MGVAVWLPMGLGLIVLLTGGGIVRYARSLQSASPPLDRGEHEPGDASKAMSLPPSNSGRFDGAMSAMWCGVGAVIAGAFLIIVSAISLARR